MPLSEREQELLEQMERALYEEDPRFATQLRAGADGIVRRRRYVTAGAVVVLGLAVVVAAVMLENLVLGALGFVIMIAGGAYAVAPARPALGTVQPDGSVRPARAGHPAGRALGGATSLTRALDQNKGAQNRSPRTGSFMERLEQRWEERRERGEL